jgi:hypothetical protein
MSDIWSPPKAELRDVGPSENPEAVDIRQRHINHEASVRSAGTLYYLSGILLILAGAVGMFNNGIIPGPTRNIIFSAFFFGLGALQFWIGSGLRGLKSRGRIGGGIISTIGLLGFPMGTLINAYILYLLFSSKGATVFSKEYQQVIAQTPDIKYRTSIIVWIFLALLVALVGFAFISSIFSRHG